ncbi:MAG: hypothetical protein F4X44_13210 [Gammaproteobacteria bacterium]|nr:hypothetical protein [Gammaproteobacteria bacterium]MYD81555.1 hypothetical protein [Gammaproteobacteria bacterium]
MNSVSDVSDRLMELATNTRGFAYLQLLDSFLLQADVGQLETIIDKSNQIQSPHALHLTQDEVFRRFALVSPIQAIANLDKIPQIRRDHSLRIILAEWSHYDLDECVKHVNTMEESDRVLAFITIMNTLSDTSPNRLREIKENLNISSGLNDLVAMNKEYESQDHPATDWNRMLNDSTDDSSQFLEMLPVVMKWIEHEGLDALTQVRNSLGDDTLRLQLVHRALELHSRFSPHEAFSYAIQTYQADMYASVHRLAMNWVIRDPDAVFVALAEIESIELRKSLEEAALDAWAGLNPHEFLDQLDNLPHWLQEVAQEIAIRTMLLVDPKEAANRLFVDSNEGTLGQAQTIVSSWSSINALEAFQWVATNPHVRKYQLSLVQNALSNLSVEESEQAMQTATAQPLNSLGLGMEAYVVTWLAKQDLQAAKSMLPRTREGITRLMAYLAVGERLAKNEDYQEAISLVHDLPEDYHANYFDGLFRRFASARPALVYSEIEQLPSTEARSSAAKWLVLYNRFLGEESLSELQLEKLRSHITKEDLEDLNEQDRLYDIFEHLLQD